MSAPLPHHQTTTPRQFRLGADTLAELDYLAERLGLTSRADVIRHLARRSALAEGYSDQSQSEKKKKKSGKTA